MTQYLVTKQLYDFDHDVFIGDKITVYAGPDLDTALTIFGLDDDHQPDTGTHFVLSVSKD